MSTTFYSVYYTRYSLYCNEKIFLEHCLELENVLFLPTIPVWGENSCYNIRIILNGIMNFPSHIKYFSQGDLSFSPLMILIFLPVIIYVVQLVMHKKEEIFKTKFYILISLIVGIYPILIIYIMNPVWRLFSNHGLLHSSFHFQIRSGNIPPPMVFLAGEPMHYNWGYECISAFVSRVLNLTPSYSFALINIVSLLFCMILVYKIASFFLNNHRTQIFSVIVSLYGITLFFEQSPLVPTRLMKALDVNSIERRISPILLKFSNVNGDSIGLVFFLCFIYSILLIFLTNKKLRASYYLFFSVISCGFVYSPFVPGLIISALSVCLLHFLMGDRSDLIKRFKESGIVLLVFTLGVIVIFPYFFSIQSGAKGRLHFFVVESMIRDITSIVVILAPLSIIMIITLPRILKLVNKRALYLIGSVICANICCYICLHLPSNNEYKFLILGTVPFGIIGGISFSFIRERFGRYIATILILPFIVPVYVDMHCKSNIMKELENPFIEHPSYIGHKNQSINEIYQWLRLNTPTDSIIIDTNFLSPLLAQRQLFVATRIKGFGENTFSNLPGFAPMSFFLKSILGYNKKIVQQRVAVVRRIYKNDGELSESDKQHLKKFKKNVYIVISTKMMKRKLERSLCKLVFATSDSKWIFQLQ